MAIAQAGGFGSPREEDDLPDRCGQTADQFTVLLSAVQGHTVWPVLLGPEAVRVTWCRDTVPEVRPDGDFPMSDHPLDAGPSCVRAQAKGGHGDRNERSLLIAPMACAWVAQLLRR
jgi:hypothetical protein